MKAKMLNGTINGSIVSTGRTSIFNDGFRKVIAREVEKARYNPDEDPFYREHNRKVEKILRSM